MKKVFTLLVSFLLIVGFMACGKKTDGYQDKYAETISESPIWSIESLYPQSDTVYVYTAFWSFASLQLVKTDTDPGHILYKMVFNPPEKVKNAETVTVCVGEKALTVNDEVFGAHDKLEYENILKMVEEKYVYYSSLFNEK